MAIDRSPLFLTEYPELISLESLIVSILFTGFMGFVCGIIHFLANDVRSI